MPEIQVQPKPLCCLECEAEADERARGWRAYRSEGYEGEDVEIGIFCPDCAEREFGS